MEHDTVQAWCFSTASGTLPRRRDLQLTAERERYLADIHSVWLSTRALCSGITATPAGTTVQAVCADDWQPSELFEATPAVRLLMVS